MLALLRNLHAAANPTRWDHFRFVASPQTASFSCSCMWTPQQPKCCLRQAVASSSCPQPIAVPFGLHGLVLVPC